jgi:hypothetical protein
LAEFVARYPNGAWGQAQLGLTGLSLAMIGGGLVFLAGAVRRRQARR